MHLPLEPPRGVPVHDIVNGEPLLEQKKDPATKLRENIARILADKGADFAHLLLDELSSDEDENDDSSDTQAKKDATPANDPNVPITYEDLSTMRQDALVKLDVAGGELSQALEVVNLLISASKPNEPSPNPLLSSGSLTTTHVAPSVPKSSVQAIDARLILGTKDSSLKNASTVLSQAAANIGEFVQRGEVHWAQAILIRRSNWPITPKPLPPGQTPLSLRKDADHLARDFYVSYGLENSLPYFRRQALASLGESTEGLNDPKSLSFSSSQRRRLRVTLTSKGTSDIQTITSNDVELVQEVDLGIEALDSRLAAAQKEIVEEELFAELIREAGTFSSAAAFVSERRIRIEGAPNLELTLEMVSADTVHPPSLSLQDSSPHKHVSSLILHTLTLLLLRHHRHRANLAQTNRLPPYLQRGPAPPPPPFSFSRPPAILAPVLSLVQYYAFCSEMKRNLDAIQRCLEAVGVGCVLMFDPVGEGCVESLIEGLSSSESGEKSGGAGQASSNAHAEENHLPWLGVHVSGEANLWIDDRYSLRFTLASPTTLTFHLAHTTLPIPNLTLMRRLLLGEIALRLLGTLREKGEELLGGRWSLDRLDVEGLFGQWDSIGLRMQLSFDEAFQLHCVAYVEKETENPTSYNASVKVQGEEGQTLTNVRVERYSSLPHEPLKKEDEQGTTQSGQRHPLLAEWFEELCQWLKREIR